MPTAGAVDEVDWSRDAATATVGRLLDATRRLDAAAADVVVELVRTVADGATERALGAAVEVVLAQSCRLPGFERRALLRAADALGRMPATLHRFRVGRLSWAQVRAVVTAAGRVRTDDLAWLDDTVAALVDELGECEGDWLVWDLDRRVDALLAARQRPDRRGTHDTNRTVLQPGLDGSGRGWFEYDPDHFPLFATALDAHATTSGDTPLHDGLDRHADLLDPARAAGPGGASRRPDEVVADRALTDAARHAADLADRNARRRGASLFELVTGHRAETLEPAPVGGAGGSTRPSVLVTCTIGDLVGDGGPDERLGGPVPAVTGVAWWLGSLAGRIKVSSRVVRRWVAAHGADVRLVALDDLGEVVGVGRRTRLAPGWMRDAVVARDLHCTGPASTTPAVLCDVDHVRAWEDGGRTDVDNLTLLSRRWHTRKTDGHWHMTRHAGGARTWTNARGWSTRQPPRRHHDPPPPARGP